MTLARISLGYEKIRLCGERARHDGLQYFWVNTCCIEITGIAFPAIRGVPLSQFGVDERLSWIRNRQTKLEEDTAYSLLGIFDVYMPLIYGEGRDNAFTRLREEIKG